MKIIATRLSIFAAILVAFGGGYFMGKSSPVSLTPNTYGDFEATVKATRDGDTLVVEVLGDKEPIRYIGIDTPETKHPEKGVECFGPEAADKSKALVLGKIVRFERDRQNRDHRGRLLRYVWVGDEMINEKLVRDGYARASFVSPNGKYRKLFEDAEREAFEAKRGLWGACSYPEPEKTKSKKPRR